MESEAPRNSLFNWTIAALGMPYLAIFGLAGLMCLVLTIVLVLRGKGPMAAAALILVVHIPLLIGIFAALQGAISSFILVATSGTSPKPSELAVGTSTALLAPVVGLLVMAPSYLIAIFGAVVRSLNGKPKSD